MHQLRVLHHPRRRAAALAAACVLGACVLAPSALAAPDWTASVDHPLQPRAFAPETIERYQAGGRATVVYLEVVSLSAPLQTVLHVGTRAPGGGYVESFSRASTASRIPIDVSLAVAPSGAAVVGVVDAVDGAGGGRAFSALYRPEGSGDFRAAETLLTDPVASPGNQDMAVTIGADGTAAVSVEHLEADGPAEPAPGQTDSRLDVAVHAPGAGAWGAAARISAPDESVGGQALGVDGQGNVTAVYGQRWSEGAASGDGDDRFQLVERRRSASTGAFSSAEELTPASFTHDTGGGTLAVNARGDAIVGYQVSSPGANEAHVRTRVGASGSWTTPALVSADAAAAASAVTPGGRAYLLYHFFAQSSSESCFGAVRGQVGGGFTGGRCISRKNLSASEGRVTTVGEDAYFAMHGTQPGNQGNSSILAARWADAAPLPDVSHDTDSAGGAYSVDTIQDDGDGSAVMTWFAGSGDTAVRRLSAFDGGAPTISGLSVPPSATAGQAVAISAALADTWSPLAGGQPTWDFGDGSPAASGASVGHTFTQPGTHTVTVRASDARGNTRTATATITVTAAPVSVPGDRLAPSASLTLPKGKKQLHARSSFRTLRGSVVDPAPASAITSVEVAVFRLRGKTAFSLKGKAFKKTSRKKAEVAFVAAKVSGNTWSLKLPRLVAGKYVVLVRATDGAGNRSAAKRTTLKLT